MKERILKVIGQQLDKNPEEIELYDSLVDDLGADSLDSVELIMALEEELQVEILDDECVEWVTVNDVVEHFNVL